MTIDEVLKWYDIYELQTGEENYIQENRYDKDGNKKTLPPMSTIREIVINDIIDRRKRTWLERVDFLYSEK